MRRAAALFPAQSMWFLRLRTPSRCRSLPRRRQPFLPCRCCARPCRLMPAAPVFRRASLWLLQARVLTAWRRVFPPAIDAAATPKAAAMQGLHSLRRFPCRFLLHQRQNRPRRQTTVLRTTPPARTLPTTTGQTAATLHALLLTATPIPATTAAAMTIEGMAGVGAARMMMGVSQAAIGGRERGAITSE